MELDEGWTKGESFERFITQRSPHCTVANGFSVIFAKVLVGISGNPRRMYLFAYGSHWIGFKVAGGILAVVWSSHVNKFGGKG